MPPALGASRRMFVPRAAGHASDWKRSAVQQRRNQSRVAAATRPAGDERFDYSAINAPVNIMHDAEYSL